MAQKNLSPSDITLSLKKAKQFFIKHASLLFVVVVLAALVYSVSAVNYILNTSTDADYRMKKESETTSTQFDKKTIQKIESLGDRQNPPEPLIPSGRINPFSE